MNPQEAASVDEMWELGETDATTTSRRRREQGGFGHIFSTAAIRRIAISAVASCQRLSLLPPTSSPALCQMRNTAKTSR